MNGTDWEMFSGKVGAGRLLSEEGAADLTSASGV
jgi:hypothetical protein